MTEREIQVLEMEVERVVHHSPFLFTVELRRIGGCDGSPIHYLPGQFVQVQIPKLDGMLLRRPFSIYYSRNDLIGLLIQVLGRGTAHLARTIKVGDIYSVILPLGNHFSEPVGDTPLLIGGGVGLAPLFSLGESIKNKGKNVHFLLGARSADAFPDISEFYKIGDINITTEDGSLGERGFVTNHSILASNDFKVSDIYSCGPTPMMKAVARIAEERGVHCEVSLENHMACGFGVCLCCVESTKDGHRTVCTDGPVFNIKDLNW